MSKEMRIEVITYEKERLDYFTDLMKKAQKRYNRLFKKFKDAPILSAYHEVMCNAGREAHFHGDVVEMLEKGYREQKKGEWIQQLRPYEDEIVCSVCGANFNIIDNCTEQFDFCPHCGAEMKGDKK